MNKKIQFKVEEITSIQKVGVVIFGKILSENDFIVKSGLTIKGCAITGGQIPRALDKNGQQRKNFWGLTLKKANEKVNFSIGETVELSQ